LPDAWHALGRQPAGPGQLVERLDDPFALEVHPAIDAGAQAAGLPALPAYVPRDHDERLRDVVRRAAISGSSAVAVLVGGSSTGKTRACWEAVKNLPGGWQLWHPINPGRSEAALAELPRIGPRTVVWLNEAQRYLLTPAAELGERVAAGLRRRREHRPAMAAEEPHDPPTCCNCGTYTLRYIRSIHSTSKATCSDRTSATLRATVIPSSGRTAPVGQPTAPSGSDTGTGHPATV
jgi:hypothetical protein